MLGWSMQDGDLIIVLELSYAKAVEDFPDSYHPEGFEFDCT
jgi:hypothetical protein